MIEHSKHIASERETDTHHAGGWPHYGGMKPNAAHNQCVSPFYPWNPWGDCPPLKQYPEPDLTKLFNVAVPACGGNQHVWACEHAEQCKCGKASRKVEPKKCAACGK